MPFTNNRPGNAWFHAFVNRHPEIAQRHTESTSRSRGAVTELSIRGWFSDLTKLLKERNMEYVLGILETANVNLMLMRLDFNLIHMVAESVGCKK